MFGERGKSSIGPLWGVEFYHHSGYEDKTGFVCLVFILKSYTRVRTESRKRVLRKSSLPSDGMRCGLSIPLSS